VYMYVQIPCCACRCLRVLVDRVTDPREHEPALYWARHLGWRESLAVLHDLQFRQILADFDSDSDSSVDVQDCCDESNNVDTISVGSDPNDLGHLETSTPATSPLLSIWRFVQWVDVCDPIEQLVASGHDVNVQDRYGRTCLHFAVEEQNVSGIRTLLRLGADGDLVDTCGATPLWHAVYWNKLSMVKELLYAGVRLECTAHQDAGRLGLPYSPDHVLDPSTAPCSTLEIAVKKDFTAITRMLLEAGYKLDNYEFILRVARQKSRCILEEYGSQPLSLFTQARNFVRKRCGRNIHTLVRDVDLPFRVRDCLLLRDLFDLNIKVY